jgi:hypothetical protein
MISRPLFPKRFFEKEYPKLLKLTDSQGRLPVISIVLPEGKRMDLRQFEITDDGLLVNLSSGHFLISYASILSLQVMSQSFKKTSVSSPCPPWAG